MRTICLNFQVHQQYKLRTYRFFDIGNNHYYFDDFQNKRMIREATEKCYIPTNNILMNIIKEYGKVFKVSFYISGVAIDMFERWAPEVITSFQELSKTGCIEFLAGTYSHSLVCLKDKEEFKRQVKQHSAKIKQLFDHKPTTFVNTELVYSDEIGKAISDMGYKLVVTEGAKHVLGWKSPNFLYHNAIDPEQYVITRNFRLSDDISFRFSNQEWSEWPLTASKFAEWINATDKKQEVTTLFLDYETFGQRHCAESGIFDFLHHLPKAILTHTDFTFSTPKEIGDKHTSMGAIVVPYPMSWADEERDLTGWLGNEMQQEAFDKLYEAGELVNKLKNDEVTETWNRIQSCGNLYFMNTKWFSDKDVCRYDNPYSSPYEAFINYMNVIVDFKLYVEGLLKVK